MNNITDWEAISNKEITNIGEKTYSAIDIRTKLAWEYYRESIYIASGTPEQLMDNAISEVDMFLDKLHNTKK